MKKLIILILIAFSASIVAVSASSPTVKLKTEPVGDVRANSLAIPGGWVVQSQIEKGSKLSVRYKIEVSGQSPVPLNGYAVMTKFQKPDGTYSSEYWVVSNTVLNPGQSETIQHNTDQIADMTGQWKVWYWLYDKDKTYIIDWHNNNPATFDVVESKPVASISVEGVVASVTLIGAAAAVLIRQYS